jgi:hypothetical protein
MNKAANSYLPWLRKQMRQLTDLCKRLDLEQAAIEGVYQTAGKIAYDAGERAMRWCRWQA